MATTTTAPDLTGPAEAIASSSHLVSEPDSLAMQVDSDDAELSRSNSLVPITEDPESVSSSMRSSSRRDKGKGKEKAVAVRIKEEPATATVPTNETVGVTASVSEIHC